MSFTRFLLGLALLNLQINSGSSSSTKKHSKYTIPQFEVTLTIDTSKNTQYQYTSFSSPAHQLDISYRLKSATTSYLFDYIESILQQYAEGEEDRSTVENIELEASLQANNGNGNSNSDNNGNSNSNGNERIRRLGGDDGSTNENEVHLVVEMIGNVDISVVNNEYFAVNQDKVENMAYTAFLGSIAVKQYLSKIQSILPEATSVKVKSDTRLAPIPGKIKPNTGARIGVILLTFFLTSAVLLFAGWFYREYKFKRYGKRNRKGHLLMDIEQHSDYYVDDGVRSFTELEEDSSIESYDKEPIQFIPIPARFDEVKNGRKNTKPEQSDVTPRRYVTPASPFDLLYGAAFTHSDKAKVQLSRAMKMKKKTRRNVKQPKARQLKPLNTITEVVEEESNESFFPQIMSSISSFISDKIESSTPKNNKDDFLVYRDFPRHDGTPCVMFQPVDDVDWEASKEKRKQDDKSPPQTAFNLKDDDDDADLSYDSNSSSDSKDGKEDVDCFVDKLEALMAARSRQYEERKKLDNEISERKKLRLERRLKEKEELKTRDNDNDADSDSDSLEESTSDLEVSITNLDKSTDVTTIETEGRNEGDLLSLEMMTTEEKNECDLLTLEMTTEEKKANLELTPSKSASDVETHNEILLPTTTTIETEDKNEDKMLSLDTLTDDKNGGEHNATYSIVSTPIVPPVETDMMKETTEEKGFVDSKEPSSIEDSPYNDISLKADLLMSPNPISPRDVESLHFEEEAASQKLESQENSANVNISILEDVIM